MKIQASLARHSRTALKKLFSDESEGQLQGAPDRPLFEALLLLLVFYAGAYLPGLYQDSDRLVSGTSAYVLFLLTLLPKVLFLLYFMSRSEGQAAFGIRGFERRDIRLTLATAFGAFAVVIPFGLALRLLGFQNPLLESLRQAGAPDNRLLFSLVILLVCLGVGYSEELFFRVYLIRRLRQTGLSPAWACVVSSLAFGAAHGAQGVPGLALASLLGGWFSLRWMRDRGFHGLALGHALYDFMVFMAALAAGPLTGLSGF